MSRWFRHYAGMMRDDKLVRVAIRSKQTIERVVWVYGAILESASEIDDAGTYDFCPSEAAYFLRADEDDVLGIMRELEIAGRISEGRVVKWGNRQFQSDRSAERVARHRARKKQGLSDSDDEPGNGAVTLHDEPRNAPETETETEEDSEEADASSGAVAPKGPTAIELRAAVFSSGVDLLQRTGSTEKNARSMLGRWRSDYGDAAVLDALAAATASDISEPIPWIRRRLETAHGKISRLRGTRPDPALDLARRGASIEAAEGSGRDSTPDWRARPALPAVRTG